MIARLAGTLVEKSTERLVVDVGGVGYLVHVSLQTFIDLPPAGANVKGLGPRTSLAVLSGMPVGDLLAAIAGGDASRLQTIQGIGKRFAERIVVECREAAAVLAAGNGSAPHKAPMPLPGPLEEAVSALVNLGYRRAEAERAVERVAGNGAPVEDVIRGALQGLAG